MSLWPKRITMYVNGDKESNWEIGGNLGLSESTIKTKFKYCLLEVGIEIDVYQNGEYKIIGIEQE